ncbi:FtsW/RodA/SpoVE family cell cycle protein [Bacillus methanolicus]|uniref:Probable peptidoglycan glycosyltransferase FtsW n=1 Tax=Bacillus methanolicus (strain MGA3 / ATCC 53907) TaxID=796606 RepID=I3DYW7_BACMM|nr:FtsW/RodA/SpoVE family cell cycle protein [Bacillus methanolicus]AIE59513.1 Lipid II flippase FtsW [Bacillus methanolicus MGA3]EIJ79438.1 cell division protein FtsW [Bacillus methanolicus MGA3]
MLKKMLKSYDYSLIIVMVLLSLFGLVMVYSASMVWAVQRYGLPSDFFYQRQKMFLIGAFIVFLCAALFPYKMMKSNKILGFIVVMSLFGLMSLFVFGHIAGNAQSWFKIGGLSLQPSEFTKIAVIIYLSAVYAKKQSYINEFNKGVVPPLVYIVLVCILVVIQPDFGTALIIFLIAAAIILSSGMNWKNISKLIMIGILVASPVVLVMKDDLFTKEQRERFEAVKNPFKDEQNTGFQLTNSLLAIGSGGINGLGLGKSIQKLGYLPESHTDFIMAVIAEELGVWGVSFVILSLGYIVLRGIYIALKCRDPFGSLLAIGISSMIGIQSFINLGGISGLIPLTGVPLPFISYGGSSLLQLSIAMGILVNVSMFVNYEEKYKKNNEKKIVA